MTTLLDDVAIVGMAETPVGRLPGRSAIQLQAEAAKKTVEATAGGGMVTVVANGKQELVSIKIDREVINPEDAQMLEDLVLAATNEALRKSKEMVQSEMGKITAGLKIPGLGL